MKKCNYDEWFVLSTKYGLFRKDDMIAPYDMTLNNMKVTERRKWAEQVLEQIEALHLNLTHIDFYAGEKYREYLIPNLEQKSISCNVPLQGKGIG